MAIRVLLMDFYGTLVQEDEQLTRTLCREICERSPQNIQPGDVSRVWWELLNVAYDACHGANFMPLCHIQQALLEELCAKFESRCDPAEMMARIRQSWEQPRAYAELRAFLTRLPLPMCVLSNADRDVFEAACRHLQLRFPHTVLSEDARSYKPRGEMFVQAMQEMNARPDEVLMVGDSLRYDMQPAIDLGMHTVWLNRNGRSRGDVKIDGALKDLLQLKGMMK